LSYQKSIIAQSTPDCFTAKTITQVVAPVVFAGRSSHSSSQGKEQYGSYPECVTTTLRVQATEHIVTDFFPSTAE